VAKDCSNTEREVSFTIPAELYRGFASFAAEKRVPIARVFRYALKEFSEYAFPNLVIDVAFEPSRAWAETQPSTTEPELSEATPDKKELVN
jgi:hypothetical protein